MSRMSRSFRLSLPIAALVLAAAVPAAARPVWTPVFDQGVLQIEIMKPALNGDPDLDFLSSVTFASVSVPLQPGVNLVGDLSYSHIDAEYGSSSSTLGNPHLGVEYRVPGDDLAVEIGLRVPLVDKDETSARLYGAYGDLSRWAAWVDEVLPVNVTAHVLTLGPSGFGFRFDGGPVFWISTDDDRDSDIYLLYAAQLVYLAENMRFNGGINGRALITEDEFEIDRSTMHELGMSVCFRAGTVWPGLTMRVPLDEDYSHFVESVVAAQVSFQLK